MAEFIIALWSSLVAMFIFTRLRELVHYYSYNETEKRKEAKIEKFLKMEKIMKARFQQERTMKEKVDAIMAMQTEALENAGHKNFLTQDEINRMRDQVLRTQKQKTSGRRREWI